MNRYLYRGRRCDNGEWAVGLLAKSRADLKVPDSIVLNDWFENDMGMVIGHREKVDPTTVEPVKVKPATKSREWVHGGIAYYCPSCDIKFHGIYLREGKVCGVRPFCSNCGQALDWAEGSAE